MFPYGPEVFCGVRKGLMILTLREKEGQRIGGIKLGKVSENGAVQGMQNCLNIPKKSLRIIVGIFTSYYRRNYFQ